MGRSSRDKGARNERDAMKQLGGEKVSRAWAPGADGLWRNRQIEVKVRAAGFKMLYRWLEDAAIVAHRADRKEWLVTLRLSELLDLLDEAKEEGL